MKYIKKKLINNKEYYYFEFPLRINDNKYVYTKYLGQYFPSDLKLTLNKYFTDIGKFVSDKITSNSKKYFPPNSVEKIENARFKYHMINHELFKKDLDLFRTLFYILFVLNSKEYFPPNSVEKIENARFKYHMINHELFKKDLDLFRTLFYILFVLNS